MSTPHDVPTHLLENPDQYITRVGKILRKYSLDELPQIWDIFVGNITTVGPRPALWNQKDLIAQRDLYYANDVKPGLTGWAQINGRDELEIDVKASLDGEYTRALQKNSLSGFMMDVKCFVDADPDDRLIRVIARDCIERGRTPQMVIDRYEDVLKPMHSMYIEPTKRYADLIIPQGGKNAVAIGLLTDFIDGRLKRRCN